VYTTHIHSTVQPTKLELLFDLERLTLTNTLWYLREWAAGRDPACCCGCAGVRYKRDRLGYEIDLIPAEIVFKTKVASCGPAAAISAAHHRAEEIREAMGEPVFNLDEYLAARARWGLELIEQVPGLYHAVVIEPNGQTDDPTKEMEAL
jgi:hypothetical protein